MGVIYLVSIYAPTEVSDLTGKDAFYVLDLRDILCFNLSWPTFLLLNGINPV